MSTLQGAPQLRARLRALKVAFKPIGRQWADTTVVEMRPQAPHRTGKGVRSIRVRNASMSKATVAAIYYMGILDKGSKAHDIVPKKAERLAFKVGGVAVFAKKVSIRARSGMHFAARAARASLRRHPMAQGLIDQWNAAA